MAQKGLLKGKKISGKHSSVIEAATPLIFILKADARVSKIVLGIIKRIKNGPHRVSVKNIQAGLDVKVRSGNSVQQFYVYTHDGDGVKEVILREFD